MGSQLPVKQKRIVQQHAKYISFVSAQMQGWRPSMEDASAYSLDLGDGNSLFAVFDGHAGGSMSIYVSNIFVKQLKNINSYKNKQYKKALFDLFKRIDEILQTEEAQVEMNIIKQKLDLDFNDFRLKDKSDEGRESAKGLQGCTAIVLLMTPLTYFIANLGDSHSALCRQGIAIDLSKQNHTPNIAQQQKRINRAGGTVIHGRINGGLNISRCFGAFCMKENQELPYNQQMVICCPDVYQFEVSSRDEFIVMGSDGIWEKDINQKQNLITQIREELKRNKKPVSIVTELLDNLVPRFQTEIVGTDNMTIILIVIHH